MHFFQGLDMIAEPERLLKIGARVIFKCYDSLIENQIGHPWARLTRVAPIDVKQHTIQRGNNSRVSDLVSRFPVLFSKRLTVKKYVPPDIR